MTEYEAQAKQFLDDCNATMEIYNPMTHGAIIAVHIYLEDGYKPMAELAFAFGGTETIHWDDVKEREPYLKGINAYTIMCDDRAKFPFEKYVIARNKQNGT